MTTFTRRKRNQLSLKLFIAGAVGIVLFAIAIRARAESATGVSGPPSPVSSPQGEDAGAIGQPGLPEFKDIDYGELPGKVDEKSNRFVDRLTLAPVAALRTAGLDGSSTFGAGLDAGVGINPFVSLHGAAYTYETDDWRSSAVDEAELYGRANFARFADESFVLYGKGGVGYEFNERDFGFGVGVGAEVSFTKHLSAGADYTIRAWFDREKDDLARVFVAGSF